MILLLFIMCTAHVVIVATISNDDYVIMWREVWNVSFELFMYLPCR